MGTYVNRKLFDQLFVCSLRMNNCSLQFSFCESLMHGFSSYDSCSTNSCTHTDTIRVCCIRMHMCVSFSWVWLFNGILFRNEIAAKCNSIGVLQPKAPNYHGIRKNKWINFGFRCFEHTQTHRRTYTQAHSLTRNVVVIAVGFWTFTAKLENLLLIFYFWAQSSTLPQPPPQQSPSNL